jgi:hypothetical protein
MDFIDIAGLSGTVYRFRRWPDAGGVPPIAGNYALVDTRTRTATSVGVLDDLSQAPNTLGAAAAAHIIFTRFNVSRAHREAEHADLVAQHPHLSTNLA